MPSIDDPDLPQQGLVLVNCHLSDEHLCISLCNATLTRRHWALYENKAYIKISTDGVYRMCNQTCALCFVGLLGKAIGTHRDMNSDSPVYCFPTSFRELMVCIVSTEHSVTYERMFQDLDHLMHRLCGVPQFSALVGQVHGDFHSGLQIARENHFRRGPFRACLVLRPFFLEGHASRMLLSLLDFFRVWLLVIALTLPWCLFIFRF